MSVLFQAARPQFAVLVACTLWMQAMVLGASPARAGEPPRGMFELYAQNRDQGIANYITGDFLLLSYSLIRRRTIAAAEQGVVMPNFRSLVEGLGEALEAAEDSPATRANREFIAILAALLNGTDAAGIGPEAREELALVRSAAAPVASPLWGMTMDYTQFRPRGRYRAEDLQGYFRAVRYAGAVLFAVTPSLATGVSPEDARRMAAGALQLARLIDSRPELRRAMGELDRTLGWQFGPASELRNADLLAVADGEGADTDLPGRLLAHARRIGLQPRVIGGVVDAARLEPGLSAADAMTGWRLLPLREGMDAVALQALVYDRTGEFRPDSNPARQPFGLSFLHGRAVKGWASAREIMAALGSSAARQWITDNGEDRFGSYSEAMKQVQATVAAATGLAALQRDLLIAGLDAGSVSAAGPPDPAQRLESMLGFWTWQRYLDLLYAKQSYTLSGKSLSLSPRRPGARIEPATALYEALARVVDGHRRHTPSPYWDQFRILLGRAIELSERAARGEPSNSEDEAFLNGLDLELLRLTGGADAPIVVDVHTNPAEGKVLQEAIGYPRSVSPGAHSRGARFRHIEFKQPMSRRLTDGTWREMLAAGTVPAAGDSTEAGP